MSLERHRCTVTFLNGDHLSWRNMRSGYLYLISSMLEKYFTVLSSVCCQIVLRLCARMSAGLPHRYRPAIAAMRLS